MGWFLVHHRNNLTFLPIASAVNNIFKLTAIKKLAILSILGYGIFIVMLPIIIRLIVMRASLQK
jgi:hypothetical protein